MRDGIDWKHAIAPSLADMEALAAEAWKRLPPRIREACGDLAIRVEDEPLGEVLKKFGMTSPHDILGLYSGYSLKQRSVWASARLPDMVLLYRQAILYFWMNVEETLGRIVNHVLIHEIGHHIGFSDEDMAAIEADGPPPPSTRTDAQTGGGNERPSPKGKRGPRA